jgi:hypothetical protein
MQDERFTRYRDKANELVERSPALIENETIRLLSNDRIPGDEVLVRKMLFDVVSSNLARTFPDLNQLFLPMAGPQGSSELVSLAEITRTLKTEAGDEVLVLEWFEGEDSEPRFQSRLIPAASALSIDTSNSIILRSERDLQRLTAAIATEIVIERNGGYESLNVSTIRSGMFLSLADVDDYVGFRFTDETAKIYVDSHHALLSLRTELDKAYKEIDALSL